MRGLLPAAVSQDGSKRPPAAYCSLELRKVSYWWRNFSPTVKEPCLPSHSWQGGNSRKAMRNFLRGVVLKVLYPAMMFAGAFFKSRKEGFQIFIIRLNNRLVRAGSYRVGTLLLLLPHCLQTTECDVRITHNISNC